MGYDVDLVQYELPAKVKPPVAISDAGGKPIPFDKTDGVKKSLLAIEGCRETEDGAIDYNANLMSYALLTIKADRIHVLNNCSPKDLIRIYSELQKVFPKLLIQDLQSDQLHDAKSFEAWWSRPL